MNIKPCMGQSSRTWELLLCEYWRKSMIIGEKNTDLKRLTGRLKLRLLTEIGWFHWNQCEEVGHFAWFGEPCIYINKNVWRYWKYSQTCIKRSPLGQIKGSLINKWPLERGLIYMKFSLTGQEKCDLLIQVTAWAGLTVHYH